MVDTNICGECGAVAGLRARICSACRAPLRLPASGVSIWRLGDVDDDLLERLRRRLERKLGLPVYVEPAFVAASPSHRPRPWKGVSTNAFLNQVSRRRRGAREIVLGVTEANIVPGPTWNFIFGLAYLGDRSAVMSVNRLRVGRPRAERLLCRAEKIALHELGHSLGLEHHSYAQDAACSMAGDVEEDSLETLDAGTANFCGQCARSLRRRGVAVRGR